MLILARRINESIMIGDQVEISVVDIKGDQVKLGISAPKQVKVYRREVYRSIQEENVAAAKAAPERLPALDGLLPSPAEHPPGTAEHPPGTAEHPPGTAEHPPGITERPPGR
jgi:carbon storage regulator